MLSLFRHSSRDLTKQTALKRERISQQQKNHPKREFLFHFCPVEFSRIVGPAAAAAHTQKEEEFSVSLSPIRKRFLFSKKITFTKQQQDDDEMMKKKVSHTTSR
jgi:hypothetical protein